MHALHPAERRKRTLGAAPFAHLILGPRPKRVGRDRVR